MVVHDGHVVPSLRPVFFSVRCGAVPAVGLRGLSPLLGVLTELRRAAAASSPVPSTPGASRLARDVFLKRRPANSSFSTGGTPGRAPPLLPASGQLATARHQQGLLPRPGGWAAHRGFFWWRLLALGLARGRAITRQAWGCLFPVFSPRPVCFSDAHHTAPEDPRPEQGLRLVSSPWPKDRLLSPVRGCGWLAKPFSSCHAAASPEHDPRGREADATVHGNTAE